MMAEATMIVPAYEAKRKKLSRETRLWKEKIKLRIGLHAEGKKRIKRMSIEKRTSSKLTK